MPVDPAPFVSAVVKAMPKVNWPRGAYPMHPLTSSELECIWYRQRRHCGRIVVPFLGRERDSGVVNAPPERIEPVRFATPAGYLIEVAVTADGGTYTATGPQHRAGKRAVPRAA